MRNPRYRSEEHRRIGKYAVAWGGRCMICPNCEQYVFVQRPTECTSCHVAVHLCEPCFGTGQIEAWASGLNRHGRREMILCTECAGHGLVLSSRPTKTVN